jgi:hypothetical protein
MTVHIYDSTHIWQYTYMTVHIYDSTHIWQYSAELLLE